MKDCKITIVTPTYNRAHTLPRAYESLKKQTFKGFKWLIMDDGSTDNTEELVKEFQAENEFEILYFFNENQHKFHTVFDGIKKVETPYFTILDSDDSYPIEALRIMLGVAEAVINQDEYISVMGLSGDEHGNVVGDKYPFEFDSSILQMRYAYKVRGDKNGMFFTKTYQRELNNFDYSYIPKGLYIPQSVFFNTYDARGIKTRFFNQIIRIYHKDENDAASVSNTRWSGKNRYGLMLGHLSFLNSYKNQLWKYPVPLLRNLVGYHIYSFSLKDGIKELQNRLKHFRLLSLLLLPVSFLYFKLKFKNG